jgi:hypothetical protein
VDIKDHLGNEQVIIGDIKLDTTETYFSDDFEGTRITGTDVCSAGEWYVDPGVSSYNVVTSGGSMKLEVYVSGEIYDGVLRYSPRSP